MEKIGIWEGGNRHTILLLRPLNWNPGPIAPLFFSDHQVIKIEECLTSQNKNLANIEGGEEPFGKAWKTKRNDHLPLWSNMKNASTSRFFSQLAFHKNRLAFDETHLALSRGDVVQNRPNKQNTFLGMRRQQPTLA